MKHITAETKPYDRNTIQVFILLACWVGLTACCSKSSSPIDPTKNPGEITHQSPTSSPIVSTSTADSILEFTVVRIEPGKYLPIHLGPDPNTQIIGQIPSLGRGIRSINKDSLNQIESLLSVEYQGTTGWVEKPHLDRQVVDLPDELVALGQFTTLSLKEKDLDRLSQIIHPEICLRFAPYPCLQDSDRVLCPPDLNTALDSSQVYSSGHYDGTGETIQLTFADSFDQFVYDEDYFQPQVVGFNQEVSSGNMLNNIPEILPDGIMIEYHFTAFDPRYSGMDWRSLRLVFLDREGQWYLAALVHGEWTI